MLGLLLIYFIGKQFYNLAGDFNKNKWVFAILGVVSYYSGIIITGFILGFLIALGPLEGLASLPEIVLGLITIPFGILACWGLYTILKKSWSKAVSTEQNTALDGEFMQTGD